MSADIPFSPCNWIPISATVYAEHLCIWATSDKIRHLNNAIQDTFDSVISELD